MNPFKFILYLTSSSILFSIFIINHRWDIKIITNLFLNLKFVIGIYYTEVNAVDKTGKSIFIKDESLFIINEEAKL